MRFSILFLLISISSLNALIIESGKEFIESVSPDIMNSKIVVQSKTLKYDEAKMVFDNIIQLVKTNSICQGGSYSINPEFNYEKNRKIFVKFNGYLEFDCEFVESKALDNVIVLISNALPKDLFYLNIGEINWNLTAKLKQKIESRLNDTSILYGIEESNRLSSLLSMKCEAKKITTNQQIAHFALMKSNIPKDSKEISSTEAPIKKDIKLKILANYEIECKNK